MMLIANVICLPLSIINYKISQFFRTYPPYINFNLNAIVHSFLFRKLNFCPHTSFGIKEKYIFNWQLFKELADGHFLYLTKCLSVYSYATIQHLNDSAPNKIQCSQITIKSAIYEHHIVGSYQLLNYSARKFNSKDSCVPSLILLVCFIAILNILTFPLS